MKKITVRRIKGPQMDWEKLFSKYISDKGLESKKKKKAI